MYCKECGNEIEDGAQFCTGCGAPAPVIVDPNPNVEQPAVMQAEASQTISATQAPVGNKDKRLVVIVVVLAALAVIACVVAGALFLNQQEQKRVAPRAVHVHFEAQGYSDECTRIPIAVKGADSDGNAVDSVEFVDASGQGLELAPGEYQLSFPASPLTPDGILYVSPSVVDDVSISEELEGDATVNAFQSETPTFKKSTALDETDDMINTAYEYAIKDESQAQRADELKEVAANVHAQAVNAENERKAAEAARTIDTPYYVVTIPEYWVGKVEVARNGNDVIIYAKGGSMSTTVLVTVELVRQSEQLNGGDYMGGMIKNVDTSGGYRAEMWHNNWPGKPSLPNTDQKVSDALMNTCIELETGGAVTLSQIRNDHSGNGGELSMKYAQIAHEYLRDNVELIAK